MNHRMFIALVCALVALRLPSLVQPMGADQGLYAYVGERILAGELPYRDAWDQKPPAIHYIYAALRALWPASAAVPALDLAVAVGIALLLLALGTSLVSRGTGQAAALLFLFLSDPSFQRLAGVAVRAQCETFIALLVTGAFVLLARARVEPSAGRVFTAGVLLGAAVSFKYNAGAYLGAAVVALWLWRRLDWRSLGSLAAGSSLVPLAFLLVFIAGGALADLYDATITYNVRYSGETYSGLAHMVRYFLAFPIQHARVDALWLLGGAGCLVLVLRAREDRGRLVVPAWIAAACVVIAVNGSRGYPQYFVQALPALALAAAWGAALVRPRRALVGVLALVVAAYAVWRVNEFSNLGGNFVHDGAYAVGRTSERDHRERYGDPQTRKYSALAMADLAGFITASTAPEDRIYVFGFSPGVYVQADRVSASRFFWSRPVIVGFNAEKPGYGATGLRADLERARPALVALQIRDWAPMDPDSAAFFLSTPVLADWLRAGYDEVEGPAGFSTWRRR